MSRAFVTDKEDWVYCAKAEPTQPRRATKKVHLEETKEVGRTERKLETAQSTDKKTTLA